MIRNITISRSNTKIGKIASFSVPTGGTCPGKTEWCHESCYAHRSEVQYLNVIASYKRNLTSSKLSSFVRLTTLAIKALPKSYNLFRIHVAGDFYSVKYINKWIAIVKANPTMNFYAYTRSWRIPHLIPYLKKLSGLNNMSLLASTDIDTFNAGESVPQGFREAYAGDIKPSNSILCLVQSKKSPSCAACKLCTKPGLKSTIYFKTH
jgi:hypothetical protein